MTVSDRGHLCLTRQHLDMVHLFGISEQATFQFRIDDVFEYVHIWRKHGKVWRRLCTIECGQEFDLEFDSDRVTFCFNEYRGEGSVQVGIRAHRYDVQISRI